VAAGARIDDRPGGGPIAAPKTISNEDHFEPIFAILPPWRNDAVALSEKVSSRLKSSETFKG